MLFSIVTLNSESYIPREAVPSRHTAGRESGKISGTNWLWSRNRFRRSNKLVNYAYSTILISLKIYCLSKIIDLSLRVFVSRVPYALIRGLTRNSKAIHRNVPLSFCELHFRGSGTVIDRVSRRAFLLIGFAGKKIVPRRASSCNTSNEGISWLAFFVHVRTAPLPATVITWRFARQVLDGEQFPQSKRAVLPSAELVRIFLLFVATSSNISP